MAEETPNVTKASAASESNIFAALSYLWILSVIFYVIKKEDEYVQFHAKQAMVLFGMHVVSMFLWIIPPLAFLLGLLAFVLMVIGAVKAYSGSKYRIPYVADLADKINF